MSSNALLEHRVDRLEDVLIRLAEAQVETQRELLDFKNEMSEFKNEMRLDFEKYREENNLAFEKYREENRAEQRKLNQRLGEISDKMGTIVDDIIYPAARPLISRYFNVEIDDIDISSNIDRKNRNKEREEFDIIASTDDNVFLIEVKSTMRDMYIAKFKDKIKRFPDFFPEYASKTLIPVIASLSMKPNTVNQLTRNKIYAMAYREWDYMDMLNFDKLNKK
jgi:hypothetical protein